MAGALRKTMEYLGLAETEERFEEYDEYDSYEDGAQPEQAQHDPQVQSERGAAVTHLHPRGTPVARVVREHEVGQLNRITTVHPRTYNDAKDIGENFRDGVPVIMNLSDMDDADAKRLVDFAAGLIFALHGSIERVTSKVFLLSPATVEVATTGSSHRAGKGPFNQS